MITNQILQNTLDGINSITGVNMTICDEDGNTIVATGNRNVDYTASVRIFASSKADSQEVDDELFFKIFDDKHLEYVLVVESRSDNAYVVGKLVVLQVQNLNTAYKERYDKDNFIKNLLLDNLLLVDIYTRARKLHIETTAKRMVYVVEYDRSSDANVLEIISEAYAGREKDFVSAVDEKNTIIIKNVGHDSTPESVRAGAEELASILDAADAGNCKIAYGTVVSELKEVSRTYKEAKMALEVGKIFYPELRIVPYSELGIGRLIYQLPLPLCKMFIKEIFDGKNPNDLDDETLTTIDEFFRNSLNVSETSRKLYIHRNTLVYRLDKLQKTTGLDIREFDDAITFKIALMVGKYMKIMESMDY